MRRRPRRQPSGVDGGWARLAGRGRSSRRCRARQRRCLLAGSGAASSAPARQPRLPCRLLAGGLEFPVPGRKRSEIVRNLRRVLGDELGPEEAEGLAREYFRMSSCRIIDVMRLRGRARSLGKLVEIRGREHLDAALAEGKGAILCTAHFGSDSSAFSLLHASGFPVTTIGRWAHKYHPHVFRRAAVLGLRLRQAPAAPPAAADDRAHAGPDSGRGAGRSRASRQ